MREADAQRKDLAILRLLAEHNEPVGARVVSNDLRSHGIDLSERAVRYHLKIMDQRGLTRCMGEPGRLITEAGRGELQKARVSDKLGFVISRIEGLAYGTSLDLRSGRGKIVTNTSLVPAARFSEGLEVMRRVFRARYCMSDLVAVAEAGERMGALPVPAGTVGVATVCSVTLNGVLLRHGIPVQSRYGGILEVRGGKSYRFTELIGYRESTLDPAEIFIASKRTGILAASDTGEGTVLASLREVPSVCSADLQRVLDQYRRRGLGGVLAVGKPGQALLGVQVGVERLGIVVVGGLAPIAALEEVGIPTVNKAMSSLVRLEELRSVWTL
jgi:repressor of nif and glnA expression